MENNNDMDNRKSVRRRLEKDVIINRIYSGEGLDLSDEGMYVYSSHVFVKDSIINLDFELDGETVEVLAKISHFQPGIGFGVSFIDCPADVKEKILSYVKRRLDK
jgi:hypothetical protein